jgi:hypothetical protein
MRFLMLVYSGETGGPTPELVEKMSKYNEELTKAGALLALDGLHPPKEAASVVVQKGGDKSVKDGPFAEAKEMVGGYWIIKADSRGEAVEWAKKAPVLEGTRIEVRQIAEIEEFPEEIQEARGELSKEPPEQTHDD